MFADGRMAVYNKDFFFSSDKAIERAIRWSATRPRTSCDALIHQNQDFQAFRSREKMQNPVIRVGTRRWYFVQETEVTEVGILLVFSGGKLACAGLC